MGKKGGAERTLYLDITSLQHIEKAPPLEVQVERIEQSGLVPGTRIIPREEADMKFEKRWTKAKIEHPERFASETLHQETELEGANRRAQERRIKRQKKQVAKREQLSHSKENLPDGFPQSYEFEGPGGIHDIMNRRPPNNPFATFPRQRFINLEISDHSIFHPIFRGWGPNKNLTREQYCAQVSEWLKSKQKPTEWPGIPNWSELPAVDQCNILMQHYESQPRMNHHKR